MPESEATALEPEPEQNPSPTKSGQPAGRLRGRVTAALRLNNTPPAPADRSSDQRHQRSDQADPVETSVGQHFKIYVERVKERHFEVEPGEEIDFAAHW